jgi:hypothetical protein
MSKIDDLRVKIHQQQTSLSTEKDNEFINLLDKEKTNNDLSVPDER